MKRLLDPISRCLTPDSAKALLELRPDPISETRVAELAAKCNQGDLTPAERSEYEIYVHAGNLVAMLQARARLLLKRKSAA